MLLVFYYPYRHGVHFDLEATVFAVAIFGGLFFKSNKLGFVSKSKLCLLCC